MKENVDVGLVGPGDQRVKVGCDAASGRTGISSKEELALGLRTGEAIGTKRPVRQHFRD
jgi:hypothetical protein